MNFDKYFNRVYHERNYNCLHFASEIWFEITGVNVYDKMNDIVNNHKLKSKHIDIFKVLQKPVSPCIAIMKRPFTNPHVGIYVNGSIIHITELGVQCLDADVASRGFKTIRYLK